MARGSVYALVCLSAMLVACADQRTPSASDQAATADWPQVEFGRCCRLRLPPKMAEVPQYGGARDPSYVRYERPGLTIVGEFRAQAEIPSQQTTQTGWTEESILIDGREAELVSYDARDAPFLGGRTMHVRVLLPEAPTREGPPTQARGMQFAGTAHCKETADCEAALLALRMIDFAPLRSN